MNSAFLGIRCDDMILDRFSHNLWAFCRLFEASFLLSVFWIGTYLDNRQVALYPFTVCAGLGKKLVTLSP